MAARSSLAVLAVLSCARTQPDGRAVSAAAAAEPDSDEAVAASRNQRACAALGVPAAGRDAFETFGYAFDVAGGGVLLIGRGMTDGGAGLKRLAAEWGLSDVAVEICAGGRFGFMLPGVRASATQRLEKEVAAAGLVVDEHVVFSAVDGLDWLRAHIKDPARGRLILRTRAREAICRELAREVLRQDDVPAERLAPCLRQPYVRFDCLMSPDGVAGRACREGMRPLFSASSP